MCIRDSCTGKPLCWCSCLGLKIETSVEVRRILDLANKHHLTDGQIGGENTGKHSLGWMKTTARSQSTFPWRVLSLVYYRRIRTLAVSLGVGVHVPPYIQRCTENLNTVNSFWRLIHVFTVSHCICIWKPVTVTYSSGRKGRVLPKDLNKLGKAQAREVTTDP